MKEAGPSGRERVSCDEYIQSREKKKDRADIRASFIRGARKQLSSSDEAEIGGLSRRASTMLTSSHMARLGDGGQNHNTPPTKGGTTDGESPRSDGTEPS